MKRPPPLHISSGCNHQHTEQETDYYFEAVSREGYTDHDIIMEKYKLKRVLEACDERDKFQAMESK